MLHLPRKMHGGTSARWWRAGALLVIALGAALAASPAEPHHVTAVRFWSLHGVTRIAIETDGDFHVKSDRLDNPDRLFFDLIGTKPDLSHKSITVIPVSDHFVRQIRVAEPQPDVTRVVLDLEAPVESTTSRLDNPTRLIIELRSAGSAPETTKAPVREPPALIEPVPAPKPAQHRPFTPPPAAEPVTLPSLKSQDASLEPPPELHSKSTPQQLPAALAVTSLQALRLTAWPRPGYWAKPAFGGAGSVIESTPLSREPLSKPSLANATVSNASLSNAPPAPVETALPAKRNSSGDRSMIRVLGLKVGRIVLDPGHGGHDTGTVGPGGLREKDLVLDVAQRLGRLIEERMGSEVIFTRSDDTFVPLERRTEIANEAKADLFLSIHANSSPLRSAAGVETTI